jgi:hypothetical protein
MNFRQWLVLVVCLSSLSVWAAPLTVGGAVPAFIAQDQFGAAFNSTNGVRFLLVAAEMGCARAGNQKLAEQGAGFLERHHAAYVMDVHQMPALVRWMVLPKLRKFPQRIILVETAGTLAVIPGQPGRVTVLALTATGRVRSIGYWNPLQEPVTVCFP